MSGPPRASNSSPSSISSTGTPSTPEEGKQWEYKDCISCRVVGTGALGLTGLCAFRMARPRAPGSVFGKMMMAGIGVGELHYSWSHYILSLSIPSVLSFGTLEKKEDFPRTNTYTFSHRISGRKCGEMEHDPYRNAGDVYQPDPWCSAVTGFIIQFAPSHVVCFILSVWDNLEHGHRSDLDFACESLHRYQIHKSNRTGGCYFHLPRPVGSLVQIKIPGSCPIRPECL